MYTMQAGLHESTCRNASADVSHKSHKVSAAARVQKSSCGKFDRLNFEVSCDLHEMFARASPWDRSQEPSCIMYTASTRTLIKLGYGLGSRLSPSSLFPHPHNQCITHWCLPFIPAATTTFHTWLMQGRVFTSTAKLPLLYIPKT
jgi:hypothetical protein